MAKTIKIAIAGNPNCGKTSLFNNLTGMRQHVGNWPGKTVEKKEGEFTYKGNKIDVVDLPGTYSLSAYSIEEKIARDYVVNEGVDAVVNIVDATNLERNLYLTVQLIELGANVIVALNMNNSAKKQDIHIDKKKLSTLLGVPVVEIEAIDKTKKSDLLDVVLKKADNKVKGKNKLEYGDEIKGHLDELECLIKETIKIDTHVTAKWLALKVLEDDKEVMDYMEKKKNGDKVLKKGESTMLHLSNVFGMDVDTAIADARYGFIKGLEKECVESPKEKKITTTDKIDKIVTNKYIGIPIFLAIIYLMFQITFTVAEPFMNWIDALFSFLGEWLIGVATSLNAPEWVGSLLADGIVGGVGSVIIFLPNIVLLFLIIAFLEDSGYMARAAFIMDKVMHKIGLHGKAFIPLIMGFGCNVPAIMATRTLENKKDRLLTILISPFMSCSARLPVYILFVAAFFTKHEGLIVFSLYLLGILMAIVSGLIFKNTLFKGLSSPFVMELPTYRMPTLRGMLIHTWEKSKHFLIKAGTIILSVMLLIWFMGNLPLGVEYASEESLIGIIGKTISPIFSPLGFGEWQASVALLFGVVAKEVVIGTFGTLYGVSEEGLMGVIGNNFTPLSAYAFMVFVLLYIPCIATLGVIKKETNSWKWMLFAAGYLMVVAWIMSFIVYQGGLLLGFT